jgi:glucose/arabinose dehydrogenase/cytochrome c2
MRVEPGSVHIVTRKLRWWSRRPTVLALVLLSVFVLGIFAGRWAVKSHVSTRLRATVSSLMHEKPPAALEAGAAGWESKNTALVRLHVREVSLPGFDGGGGGLQSLGDGRLLYATRSGEFGLLTAEGVAQSLGFRVDMALADLLAHPASRVEGFQPNWFRVADINVRRVGPGRFDLVVSHHHFDAARACIELRLSRGQLADSDGELRLSGEFRTVLSTTPCITFNQPGYEHAFEGHFSGGRIVRSGAEEVLLSTGDHGWSGLRGYPALAQDDASTLGKVLRVDLSTGRVSIFAKGFRNPQGLTMDSKGRLWATDHGPAGGDELNLVRESSNYGWPLATFGTDYGPRPWPLSPRQGRHDFGQPPQFVFVPSVGISNLIEVTGGEFGLWRGDLLVLTLARQTMYRLRMEGDRVMYAEPIVFDGHRLRSIAELPDGVLAILTDQGSVIYLRNADSVTAAPYLDARKQQPRSDELPADEQARAVAGRFAAGNQALAGGPPSLSGSADSGRAVFGTYCSTCHTVANDANMAGPSLKGVVGRRVGSTDYAYSRALAGRSEVWTSSEVVAFVADPTARFAGTTMRPVVLRPDQQRALQSYLENVASSALSVRD